MTIEDAMKERILILDGGYGSLIQNYKLGEEDFRNEKLKDHPNSLKGNNDLVGLTRPDVLREIHSNYFEAGADICETNTFSGTSIAQADYGLEHMVYEINFESAKLAREIADEFTAKDPSKPRFVAGSLGPTNKTASLSPDVNDPGLRVVTFDELVEAFQEQAEALLDGGVDLLLVETVIDTLNAKAAIFACQQAIEAKGRNEVKIMVSGTITDASGRTLSGQTTEAFLISISHAPLLSVGLNCALGADQMKPFLEVLAKKADFNVSAHPNAGLPNEFGEYDQSPQEMGRQVEQFLKEGYLNILGGCCGTTPDHIREFAKIAKNYSPRIKKQA